MSDTPETDASRLERERDAARSAAEQWERECREQCRINGLGASREASLLATVDELSKQRDRLAEALEQLLAFCERAHNGTLAGKPSRTKAAEALAAVKGADDEPIGWCSACGAKKRFCVCDEHTKDIAVRKVATKD